MTTETFMGMKLVGPFPNNKPPLRDRPGLYVRVSELGTKVLSYWDGARFGLYATNPARALARRHKRSRLKSDWYGFEQGAKPTTKS